MNVCAIVLAAGKGTRMKSALAKVLHPVFHKPMVGHVIGTLKQISLAETIVVVGHQRQAVENYLGGDGVTFTEQQEQLGTGHAVYICEQQVSASVDTVLILCGDTPLLSEKTLSAMLQTHEERDATVTLLTTKLANPTNYGRIVSDEHGHISEIVEEKDASDEIRKINEINAGVYCVQRDFLFSALAEVGTDNAQGEVYLTDIISMATTRELAVSRYVCPDSNEVLGVNSRYELSLADDIMQDTFLRTLNDQGVAIQRSGSVVIHPDSVVCSDSSIGAQVTIAENVTIGCRSRIGAQCYLENCHIGDDVDIGPGSILIGAVIDNGQSLSPGSKVIV